MTAIEDIAERYTPVLPVVEGTLAEGYWRGAAEGELRLPRCEACERFHWYPLHRCPDCGGSWRWEAVRPTATLFTWTVLRWPLAPAFEERIGDIVALVVPDDVPDVRLVTNIVGADRLEIGMPLRARFAPVDESLALPLFEPSGA